MNKEINWIERNQRNYLKDVLPLDTPYSIQIETIRACNFKCVYCAYSSDKIQLYTMKLDTFTKAIKGLQKFNRKLKNFVFSGLGEPFLNKELFKMIDLVNDYTEITTVITNGSLLDKSNTDKFLQTSANEIRISLQGVTEEDYYKTCNYKINFNNFVENINYLYKNRGDKKVYLKIADISLDNEDKKNLFYKLFEDKADYLIIQKISPLQNVVDYNEIINDNSKGVYFENTQKSLVCPQPFFSMTICADGKVAPCCSLNLDSPTIGNINNNDIYEIWNDYNLKNLRVSMLNAKIESIDGCSSCVYPIYQYNKYDDIDDFREELLMKYRREEKRREEKRREEKRREEKRREEFS
ncbi:radical SAM protein [Brachyspira aalborgi]|uniref:Radical SAM protein n=1 Tax=Brachyspira aalborgi TaxID=29522 RepID=A0A5C8D2L4_9SPIR|nr:radical SAM protein [Brachyspira aalborgi]TXJ19720.1 radical SAM protein [Brachyspira aalborgi]